MSDASRRDFLRVPRLRRLWRGGWGGETGFEGVEVFEVCSRRRDISGCGKLLNIFLSCERRLGFRLAYRVRPTNDEDEGIA